MARLAPVLRAGDLPLAELHAARLDGELVAVGEAFTPIDESIGPACRAASVAHAWPARLIAERRTAAWIWGAAVDPPARHQLCTSVSARARPTVPLRSSVREVVIDADEVVRFAGLRVTTPLRTIADLARFSLRFDESDALVVRRLMEVGDVSLEDCRGALDRRRNLPGKRLAWQRIHDAVAG